MNKNIFSEEALPEPTPITGNMENLTEQKIQKLTFKYPYRDGGKRIKWLCQCECGNFIGVVSTNVKKGNTKSCGCLKKDQPSARQDLTGKKFGKLTVIGSPHTGENKQGTIWQCQCECGNIIDVYATYLKTGKTKSCGCLKKELHSTMNDLTNQRFGKLTALYTNNVSKDGQRIWHCKCDCGKEVDVLAGNLRKGNTTSCGCKKSKNNILIENILQQKNISFQPEYSFNDLYVLNKQGLLKFDFALFKGETLIGLLEYQGIQHMQPVDFFGGEEGFKKQQIRDAKKIQYCKEHDIPLYFITYMENTEQKLEEILNELYGE